MAMQSTGTDMKMQKGVTLVELMIVIVIVAILATIAIPAYSSHVQKTRRKMAEGCLQENAQYMERWYTSKMTYVGAAATACPAEIQPFYTVTLSGVTAREFTATAQPIGAQIDDKCGTLTLDDKGKRTSSGAAVSVCW
jgi:type IV pilus assembly protein PilE